MDNTIINMFIIITHNISNNNMIINKHIQIIHNMIINHVNIDNERNV